MTSEQGPVDYDSRDNIHRILPRFYFEKLKIAWHEDSVVPTETSFDRDGLHISTPRPEAAMNEFRPEKKVRQSE